LRVVFFGTPEFAVPTLREVARHHEVVAVVAQPDKPAGRGLTLHPPAIAVVAKELGLPLLQPPKVRDPGFLDAIRALQPDLGVVIAYGKILPVSLLEIPRHGFVNVHASVLPKYRGAAPIQRAIEHGETMTGVTIMRVDEELDHGPMLAIATLPIGDEERTSSLAARLSGIGAEALLPAIDALANGTAVETPQDHGHATHAPKIEKSEGRVDWSLPSKTLFDRFRAFDPWPGIFADHAGEPVKLLEVALADGSGEPGRILSIGPDGVAVACGTGALRIITAQRPGKNRATAAEVARGFGWHAGDAFR
jgi:methionyl-tRNA formyltransferase